VRTSGRSWILRARALRSLAQVPSEPSRRHPPCGHPCCPLPRSAVRWAMELENSNPTVYARRERDSASEKERALRELDESAEDEIDAHEIFDHVRDIADPEHPHSLEQLSVLSEDAIAVDNANGTVLVHVTPTVEHCSMATLIGLCCRVKLLRVLPPCFKVDVRISPGSHAQEDAVNKQLADKERVCAALENPALAEKVRQTAQTRWAKICLRVKQFQLLHCPRTCRCRHVSTALPRCLPSWHERQSALTHISTIASRALQS